MDVYLQLLQDDHVWHTVHGLGGLLELLLSRVALHRQDLEDAI